jgi:hypothetical protein
LVNVSQDTGKDLPNKGSYCLQKIGKNIFPGKLQRKDAKKR